jgi:hypothetical protein
LQTKSQQAKQARLKANLQKETREEWDRRYAEFLERVMANAVVGGDAKLLSKELERLLAEKPKEERST